MICIHRGEQIGSILSGCPACHGKPIFACAVAKKGACAATQQQAESAAVRPCEGCSDYTPVEINCPHLKRGCCELAARIAGVPLKRCEVQRATCGACLNENATPTQRDVPRAVRRLAGSAAKAFDPGLAKHLGKG